MPPHARRPKGRLAGVAALALAVLVTAAWWLRNGTSPEAPAVPFAGVGGGSEPPRLQGLPAGPTARDRPRAEGPAGAREAARAEDPIATTAAPTAHRFPGAAAVVHARLLVPQAWVQSGAYLYALPAGARGKNGEADLPRVPLGEGSLEAMLPLPREGRWDVGFVSSLGGHVLLPDVDVTGTTEVTLAARGAEPVRFRLPRTGALPPGGWIQVRAANPCDFPGRGQQANVRIEIRFETGLPLETVPLPAGTAYDLRVGTPAAARELDGRPGSEWALSRDRASAGDEVDLLVRALGLVRNAVRLASPLPESWKKDWKADPWIAVGAQGVGEPEPSHFASTYLHRDGTLADSTLWLPLAPGRYVLDMPTTGRWRPSRDPPRTVEVEAGKTLDVDWVLEPDASLPAYGSASAPAATHSILRTGQAPRDGWLLAAEVEREGRVEWDRHGATGPAQDADLEIASDVSIRRGVLWLPPDRASLPFPIPSKGAVDVPLRPAGFVVLVPEVRPDPGLGALRVRRLDGLPLPVVKAASGGNPESIELEAVLAPAVTIGLRLGPLPEGPLSLEVLLGGERVGRVTAEVRAGKNTAVEVPLPAQPTR